MKSLLLLSLVGSVLLSGRAGNDDRSATIASADAVAGFDDSGTVTSVGVPAGVPVESVIGREGGRIISSDGRVTLNIPARALSMPTRISIVPWTNEAPCGTGPAYQLMADHITFLKAVSLTFNRPDSLDSPADGVLFLPAFQDRQNHWRIARRNNHDRCAARGVTRLDIPCFAVWALVKDTAVAGSPER